MIESLSSSETGFLFYFFMYNVNKNIELIYQINNIWLNFAADNQFNSFIIRMHVHRKKF